MSIDPLSTLFFFQNPRVFPEKQSQLFCILMPTSPCQDNMWCWRHWRFHHGSRKPTPHVIQHLWSGHWTSRIVMTCLSQHCHGNLFQIFACNLASWIIIHNDSLLKMCFLILYHSAFMITDDHSWSPIIMHDHSSFITAHDSKPSNVVLSRSMHRGADIARSCLVKLMVSLWFSDRGCPQEYADHFWAVMYRRKLYQSRFSRWHSPRFHIK